MHVAPRYDGSRNTVFHALQELDLLGKVQVIVVELACPKDDQDLPIQESESNFQFMNGRTLIIIFDKYIM